MLDNQVIAQLLFEHKLASQQDILAYWPGITPEKNIAAVLVDYGKLSHQTYAELLQYLQTIQPASEENQNIYSRASVEENSSGPSNFLVQNPDDFGLPTVEELGVQIPGEGNSSLENPDTIDGHQSKITKNENWSAALPEDLGTGLGEEFSDQLPEGEGTIQFELNTPIAPKKSTRPRNHRRGDELVPPPSETFGNSSIENAGNIPDTNNLKVTGNLKDTSNAYNTPPSATRSSPSIPRSQSPVQAPENIGPQNSWDEMLAYARQNQASDLHLSSGNPILLRRFGSLQPVSQKPIEQEIVRRWVESALDEKQLAAFETKGDLEMIYSLENWGRFRVTLMKQRRGWDITARVIPMKIRTMEETSMPESCHDLTRWAQGLVLVTGPVGCGKSSTLASLVEMVNQERHDHIISIEEPIEMLWEPAHCRITQREIGPHTQGRDAALRAALREDPDIIVISELRDLETIRLAISAAETGHLVFGTMNTTNASRTIYRLIDSFPPEEQGIIRNMISESLRGIISQQLIPRKDGTGMIPAYEVLLITSAVANMIRKDEAHQLGTAMITGKSQGMILLDDSLRALVEKGLIEPQEAISRANSPKDFEKYLGRGGR